MTTIISDAGIQFNDGTTIFSGINLGLRNRLINGNMQIAQRASSSTTQGYASVDRWYNNRTGSTPNLTQAQAYGAFGTTKTCLTLQRTSGDTNVGNLVSYQAIEGVNCAGLSGSNVTFSFNIGTGSSVATSGHGVTIYYQTTTTDKGPISAGWTSLTAQAFTVSASTSFVTKQFVFAVPSNATQLMVSISLAVPGTAGADEKFYITDAQLEQGSAATPFEQRPYGLELGLCQRYYQTGYVLQQGSAGYFMSYFGGSNGISPMQILPVIMRSAPSVTFSTTSIEYYSFAGVWTSSTLYASSFLNSSMIITFVADGDGRGKLVRTGSGGAGPAPFYLLSAEL